MTDHTIDQLLADMQHEREQQLELARESTRQMMRACYRAWQKHTRSAPASSHPGRGPNTSGGATNPLGAHDPDGTPEGGAVCERPHNPPEA